MKNDILAVNEIFGPTFQGEGKNLGSLVLFLRLAGCNLSCSWCDTRYAWDWKSYSVQKESHQLSIQSVAEKLSSLDKFDIRHLVITGGEPLLQDSALSELSNKFLSNWYIEVETSGSVMPVSTINWVDLFTVSLKLKNSENSDKRINESAIEAFLGSGKAIWKFVVENEQDFDEIDSLVKKFVLFPVYIMPEGKDVLSITEKSAKIADFALQRGYRFTTRLQVLLWGNKRGV